MICVINHYFLHLTLVEIFCLQTLGLFVLTSRFTDIKQLVKHMRLRFSERSTHIVQYCLGIAQC
jgi:hypothetical protein